MTALLAIHNIMRWVLLLTGLLALITGLRGIGGGRNFTNGDKRTALYFMISADIQLLLGLALFFMSDKMKYYSLGMKELMGNKTYRFWAVEHPIGMLAAIILVHVAYAATKGNRSHRAKFRRLFIYSLLAIVLMAATIPWPNRTNDTGRPLMPTTAAGAM